MEVKVTVDKHSGTWPSGFLDIFHGEFYPLFHRPDTVNRTCARNRELHQTRSGLAYQSGRVSISQSRPISPVTVALLTAREPQLSGRSVFPNAMRTRWKTRPIIPGMSGDTFYSSRHSLLRHKLTEDSYFFSQRRQLGISRRTIHAMSTPTKMKPTETYSKVRETPTFTWGERGGSRGTMRNVH